MSEGAYSGMFHQPLLNQRWDETSGQCASLPASISSLIRMAPSLCGGAGAHRHLTSATGTMGAATRVLAGGKEIGKRRDTDVAQRRGLDGDRRPPDSVTETVNQAVRGKRRPSRASAHRSGDQAQRLPAIATQCPADHCTTLIG